MRLIDVEQVYCAECDYKDNCKHLVDQQIIFCDVPSMPTIDAVPVVRCKDCKLWKKGNFMAGDTIEKMEYGGYCPNSRFSRYESDFCSYGERKDGAEDG